jgi:hypothetical protein
LSDILPTGFACGVLNGGFRRAIWWPSRVPGQWVLRRWLLRSFIRRAGMIMIDLNENRPQMSHRLGGS